MSAAASATTTAMGLRMGPPFVRKGFIGYRPVGEGARPEAYRPDRHLDLESRRTAPRRSASRAAALRRWSAGSGPSSRVRGARPPFLGRHHRPGLHRPAEEESLEEIAAELDHRVPLAGRLDALGDDHDAELLAERRHRADEPLLDRLGVGPPHEGHVEL